MNIIQAFNKLPCHVTFNLTELIGSKAYYTTNFSDLKPGDLVVVECREGLAIATFWGYGREEYTKKITKKIISKVPLNIFSKYYKYNNKGRV